MKEENAKSKKKVLYYLILGMCALLLTAGIVLTVYFTTGVGQPTVEKPPVTDPVKPTDPDKPNEPTKPNEPDKPNEPEKPTGGDAVKFVAPVESDGYAVSYAEVYNNGTLGWWYRHNAVDFAAAAGAQVCSMAAGTVEEISLSEELGNLITIDHGDGLKTVYRFVEPLESLKVGAKVEKGEKIGEVAKAYGSEAFQGEHLHLEMILSGEYVDPADYLDEVLAEK